MTTNNKASSTPNRQAPAPNPSNPNLVRQPPVPVRRQDALTAYAPVIANVPLPAKDTEYRYQFPEHTKKFLIHMRPQDDGSNTTFRFSFEQGAVASKQARYFTVGVNGVYSEDNLDLIGDIRIYIAHSDDLPNTWVAEIIAWK